LPVRIEQHKAVLDDGNFLDAESTIMAIFPSPMMYAGNRSYRMLFISQSAGTHNSGGIPPEFLEIYQKYLPFRVFLVDYFEHLLTF
jgi:hypothetical protein